MNDSRMIERQQKRNTPTAIKAVFEEEKGEQKEKEHFKKSACITKYKIYGLFVRFSTATLSVALNFKHV